MDKVLIFKMFVYAVACFALVWWLLGGHIDAQEPLVKLAPDTKVVTWEEIKPLLCVGMVILMVSTLDD